jgi:probable rRNA maturation factor
MMLLTTGMARKVEISVAIDDKLAASPDGRWLKSVVRLTLEAVEIKLPVEMGLFITDSETVQELNKTYRGKDKPTDVLSFYTQLQDEQEYSEFKFVPAPDGIRHLGEVVISYPQAVTQAQQQGHSLKQELTLLVVHGTLHLLGFDHEKPEEKRLMRAKEKEILRKLEATES